MFELRKLRKRTEKVQPSGKYYIDVWQINEPIPTWKITINQFGRVEHLKEDNWKDVPIVEE